RRLYICTIGTAAAAAAGSHAPIRTGTAGSGALQRRAHVIGVPAAECEHQPEQRSPTTHLSRFLLPRASSRNGPARTAGKSARCKGRRGCDRGVWAPAAVLRPQGGRNKCEHPLLEFVEPDVVAGALRPRGALEVDR